MRAAEGGVAGTRHYSSHRAGSGVVLGAMGLTAAAAPLLGLDPWSLVNIETGFALFTVSSLAGEPGQKAAWLHWMLLSPPSQPTC